MKRLTSQKKSILITYFIFILASTTMQHVLCEEQKTTTPLTFDEIAYSWTETGLMTHLFVLLPEEALRTTAFFLRLLLRREVIAWSKLAITLRGVIAVLAKY